MVAKEVMPEDLFTSDKRLPWVKMSWDDNEPFPAGHKIHFFLLNSDHIYTHCYALALVHVEGQRYPTDSSEPIPLR